MTANCDPFSVSFKSYVQGLLSPDGRYMSTQLAYVIASKIRKGKINSEDPSYTTASKLVETYGTCKEGSITDAKEEPSSFPLKELEKHIHILWIGDRLAEHSGGGIPEQSDLVLCFDGRSYRIFWAFVESYEKFTVRALSRAESAAVTVLSVLGEAAKTKTTHEAFEELHKVLSGRMTELGNTSTETMRELVGEATNDDPKGLARVDMGFMSTHMMLESKGTLAALAATLPRDLFSPSEAAPVETSSSSSKTKKKAVPLELPKKAGKASRQSEASSASTSSSSSKTKKKAEKVSRQPEAPPSEASSSSSSLATPSDKEDSASNVQSAMADARIRARIEEMSKGLLEDLNPAYLAAFIERLPAAPGAAQEKLAGAEGVIAATHVGGAPLRLFQRAISVFLHMEKGDHPKLNRMMESLMNSIASKAAAYSEKGDDKYMVLMQEFLPGDLGSKDKPCSTKTTNNLLLILMGLSMQIIPEVFAISKRAMENKMAGFAGKVARSVYEAIDSHGAARVAENAETKVALAQAGAQLKEITQKASAQVKDMAEKLAKTEEQLAEKDDEIAHLRKRLAVLEKSTKRKRSEKDSGANKKQKKTDKPKVSPIEDDDYENYTSD